MKTCLLFTIIMVLSFGLISACANKGSETKPDGSDKINTTPIAKPNTGGDQSQQLSGPLDEESVKKAHGFIPQYPGAKLDTTKGQHTKTLQGETFNLVYHTDDSVTKVADFFRAKISSQYLTEHVSPQGEDWVHLEYKVEGLKHSGGIFIRKTEDNRTEIVYMLDIVTETK